MACPTCGDFGWVCEDHPDQPFNHADPTTPDGRCGGAGMPCPDYRCSIPTTPPPMPPGWKSIAKVTDHPQGLQRVEWNGTQSTAGTVLEPGQGRPRGDLSTAQPPVGMGAASECLGRIGTVTGLPHFTRGRADVRRLATGVYRYGVDVRRPCHRFNRCSPRRAVTSRRAACPEWDPRSDPTSAVGESD